MNPTRTLHIVEMVNWSLCYLHIGHFYVFSSLCSHWTSKERLLLLYFFYCSLAPPLWSPPWSLFKRLAFLWIKKDVIHTSLPNLRPWFNGQVFCTWSPKTVVETCVGGVNVALYGRCAFWKWKCDNQPPADIFHIWNKCFDSSFGFFCQIISIVAESVCCRASLLLLRHNNQINLMLRPKQQHCHAVLMFSCCLPCQPVIHLRLKENGCKKIPQLLGRKIRLIEMGHDDCYGKNQDG